MSEARGFWRRLRSRLTPGSARDATPSAVLAAADAARARGQWAQAASLYEQHMGLRPRRLGTRIQLGNMRRQAGDGVGAEAAYRDALAIRPTVEAWLQLGHLQLLTGHVPGAVEAFESALALVPESRQARDALIAAGARGRLSDAAFTDPEALARLNALVDDLATAARRAADAAVIPLAFYDAFRHANPLPTPPPASSDESPVVILVEARGTAPNRLRATLLSLLQQTFQTWTAVVRTDAVQGDHPVAALSTMDSRIRIFDTEAASASLMGVNAGVTLTSGVVLEADALAWLAFAAGATEADVIYADHDQVTEIWPQGRRFSSPAFHPAPDPDDLATTPMPPPLVHWRGDAWKAVHSIPQADRAAAERRALVEAAAADRAAHLPLILSSVLQLSPAAANGLPAPSESDANYLAPENLDPLPPASRSGEPRPIRVIIPTRDASEMLAACIDSLLSKATSPDLVRITIVDNRSHEAATAAFLTQGVESGRFEVLQVDEPFNWSRINNLAAAACAEDRLVFLNNDTEMLTAGWDERLSAVLDRPEIGVVGARLLYPDRSLQHAGIVLGLGAGTPRHEGVGASEAEGGPLDRWRRSRATAAVTGAFLAVRRETFEAAGAFDAVHFAIGYNDIDFCLACRARGEKVLLAADIELIHHESRTRGLNDTRGRIAWDVGELTSLQDKWGAALVRDPAVNPHWATVSARPFDGIRGVARNEAVAWLLASAAGPWALRRGAPLAVQSRIVGAQRS